MVLTPAPKARPAILAPARTGEPSVLELITDLYQGLARLGPGSEAATLQALALAEAAGLSRQAPLHVADLGCGTGAATWVLAQSLSGTITAIDQQPAFLSALRMRRPRTPFWPRWSRTPRTSQSCPSLGRALI